MKTLYLRNVKKGFATNSSSYHSTLVLMEDEYKRWVDGEDVVENEDYYDEDDDKYISYEEWFGEYEGESTRFTTPNGEKIVILCKHGWG